MEGRTGSVRIIDKEAPLVRNKDTEKRLREILREYYELLVSDSRRVHLLKERFNGYSEALLSLGQIDGAALKAIIDEEHFRKFEMTAEARRQVANGASQIWSAQDWERYDEPTYLRRPLRCKRKT